MRMFRNIKQLSWIGIAAAACLALPSCISEDFDMQDTNGTGEILPKGKYFVLFDVYDTEGYNTRSDYSNDDTYDDGNFDGVVDDGLHFGDDGNHNEHTIGSNNWVIYINGNGIVEVTPLSSDVHQHYPNIEEDEFYDHSVIEGHWVSTFDVEKDTYVKPDACVVVLNAGPNSGISQNLVGKNKQVLYDLLWDESNPVNGDPYKIGRDGNYFTMTNSIYLKGGTLSFEQPLPKEVIQDYKEKFKPENVVHVTVERMVAKVDLLFDDSPERPLDPEDSFVPRVDNANIFSHFHPVTGVPQYKVVHYRVHPTGWAMNALEKQSYFFKHITDRAAEFNDETKYRNYWATDPHYDGNNFDGRHYPLQYRDAINYLDDDGYPINYYKQNVRVDGEDNVIWDNNILRNYSYNEIVAMNNLKSTDAVYLPENTFKYSSVSDDLEDRPEDLAGTHLIITAELRLKVADLLPLTETGALTADLYNEIIKKVDSQGFAPVDVYRDRIGNLYLTERQAFMASLVSFNYGIQSQSEMKYTWFNWNSHGIGDNSWVSATGVRYSLYYVDGSRYIECVPDNIEEIANLYWEYEQTQLIDEVLHDGDIKTGDGQKMIVDDKFVIRRNDGSYGQLGIYDLAHWEMVKYHNRNLGVKHTHAAAGEDWPKIPGIPEVCPYDDADHINTEIEPEISRYALVNDYKSIMFNWMGPIDHYRNGMMYYFKPVRINNSTFGLVRNNWIRYRLLGIHELGTSVDKPNEPIVPNWVETHDQAIDIASEILPWHELKFDVPVIPSGEYIDPSQYPDDWLK